MKLANFILCEDIRQETSGRPSLMGIYSGAINVSAIDKQQQNQDRSIRLGVYIKVLIEEPDCKAGVDKLELLILRNNKSLSLGAAKVEIPELPGSFFMDFSAVINPFFFQVGDDLKFALNFYDSKENLLTTDFPPFPVEFETITVK